MKRYLTLILVLLFSIGMFAGCEQLNTDVDETTDPDMDSPVNNSNSDSESANADALKAADLEVKETKPLGELSPDELDNYLEALANIAKNSLDFAEKTLSGDSNAADKNYVYSPISTWLCYEPCRILGTLLLNYYSLCFFNYLLCLPQQKQGHYNYSSFTTFHGLRRPLLPNARQDHGATV